MSENTPDEEFVEPDVTTDEADLVQPVFDTAPQDDEATEEDK